MRISVVMNTSDPEETDALRHEIQTLREQGHEVRPHLTFEAGDARRFAIEAAQRRDDLLIAAGGDGTINEVVNGLHDHLHANGGATPRLGIVPLGTGNDLAHELGLPMDIPGAIRVTGNGVIREIDVGISNDRCFLNVSSGGLGAEATDETSDDAKRILGPLAYALTGVRKFVDFTSSTARFSSDEGAIYEGSFLIFAVGNSRRTGGGNLVTPRAKLDDGLLDLCLLRGMSRIDFLKLVPRLRAGEHVGDPNVIYHQGASIRIDSSEELAVNVDGEPLPPVRRLSYRVSEHRLRVMVPAGGRGEEL